MLHYLCRLSCQACHIASCILADPILPLWGPDVCQFTCAADVRLLQCLRAQKPQPQELAAHEARKSHNVLCHALACMVACISISPLLGPLPAAPVRQFVCRSSGQMVHMSAGNVDDAL